jgi:Cytochrome c7 and related cytochrome c
MSGDVRLIRSPISVTGMVLTTVSAVLFLVVFLGELFGLHTNPYLGVLFFLILPGVFVLGLLLIPLGAWVEHRRRSAGKPPSALQWPRVDLNDPRQRTIAIIVFALTMANIVIVSLAAYSSVEYMDSVGFCGQVCHTPMKPQFQAHQQGPHAGTACVGCHVGAGARSFVAAKLAGTRRVVAVASGTYARPIVAAPEDLVPSHETCERCHSSGTFHGDTTRRIVDFADDDKNTESVTTLRMHVGGDALGGFVRGIHWHANPANQVEYIAADADRQTIPYIRVADSSGAVREYMVDGVKPELIATGTRRRMECTDCHNRAGHPIAATPQRAVSEMMARGVMARGGIPTTLPFVHREAVKALTRTYASEDVATAEIARALREFYQAQSRQNVGAESPDLERAILGVQDIYRRNVFPDMKVTFGSYPSNIGHIDFPGCFRCHDDEHKTKEGKAIGQDCETCHAIE